MPVIILPNSFGPFETKFSRWLTRFVLKRCTFVSTREAQSQNVLETLIPNLAYQFPDMAFLLKVNSADRDWASEELKKLRVKTDGSAVGFTMRPWRFPGKSSPKAAYENYLESMAGFILHIRQQGLQPVLFAHVRGPGKHETDRFALEACQRRLPDDPPILVDSEYNCIQMKALYSHLGYMVGTRFHSCIFALSQGVPALAISYQGNKASGIMADMGLPEFHMHIDDISLETLKDKFDLLQRRQMQVRDICKVYVPNAEKKLNDLSFMIAKKLEFYR